MNRLFLNTMIVLAICSCKQKPASKFEKQVIIKEEVFDTNIISKLPKYVKLERYIDEKSDTIIYQNKNIPTHIKEELQNLIKLIGKESIKSYGINDDEISIEVKISENIKGLYFSHNLIWIRNSTTKPNIVRNYKFIQQKDTIINNSCVYTIELLDHNKPNKIYGPPMVRM